MNRFLLLILLLLSSLSSYEQTNYLFIKKGFHKKRTYTEGDRIHLQLKNGEDKKGIITLLRNNIIYINGKPIPAEQVVSIIIDEKKKKPFPIDGKIALLVGGGVGLTAVGLSLNGLTKPGIAIVDAAVIGFGPILVKHFGGRLLYALHRKKYRIGKKFRLQVFDLYVPNRRAF